MKILKVTDRGTLKELEVEKDGVHHFVTAFPDLVGYDDLKEGDCDYYIRIKGYYKNLTSHYKPERNWKEGEKFI